MDLFLETLKAAIADEVPAKINDLFLQAFYSPSVWRRPAETMQAYIVRREQGFRKLEESSLGTKVSENLHAMMLLIFGGLGPREQVSVLSSINSDYDFSKISHAMSIQFPKAAGKAVQRKDYFGVSARGNAPSSSSSLLFRRPKWLVASDLFLLLMTMRWKMKRPLKTPTTTTMVMMISLAVTPMMPGLQLRMMSWWVLS